MELTKKQRLDKTYQLFFDSMMDMNFPLDKINSFVPPDVMGFGTTIDERIFGLEEFINLIKLQRKQAEGEVYWDRQPVFEKISKDGNTALFVEELKVTMKMASGDHLIPLRITSVLFYYGDKWQLVHWHGSQALEITDDTWHKEEWKQKNEALQRLVDEKTADLAAKNRELEIQASMERLRAVAMGMQGAGDLLKICEVLFKELETLGFKALRNTMVNLNNDREALLHNYDYSSKSGGEITDIPYESHPATRNMVNKLKSSANAFGQFALTGKKLDEWRDYRKKLGEKDDRRLKNTKKLSYYFYSVGTGSIGVSTYEPISKAQLMLLERFRNVFELAYRRYTDIQQAEAQAREAKIEAALEKVRARTMAMQHSREFPEAANLLFLEVQALGIPAWSCGYNILAEDKKSVICWMSSEGKIQSGFHLPFTNTGEKSFPQWEKAIKDKVPFLVQELGGKDLEAHYDYMRTLPELEPILKELDQAGLALPTYQINHLSFFQGGFLLFITYEKVPEAHDLFKRFTKVFEQAYTRFLDLQKAEAQAREAEIELALERIRAKSMAMQKSEELADLSLELVKQVQELGKETWFCAFNIYDDDAQGSMEWGSNGEGTFPKYRTPREGVFLRYYNAGQKGQTMLINEIGPDECPAHYEYLCTLPGVGDQLLTMKDAGIPFPSSQIDHVVYFKYGYILFITYDAVPELHEIFLRLAKVFEQSYTRFLDLQKAEAQAREAQVEAALERVRAQTMAMHNSEDVGNCTLKMFAELTALGVDEGTRFGIGILNHDNENNQLWTARKNMEEVNMHIGNIDMASHPLLKSARKAWKEQIPLHKYVLEGEDLLDYYQMLNNAPDYKIQIPIENLPQKEIQHCFIFEHGFFYAFSPREFQSELIRITQRFSSLFEQTYRRYLDLVKAEVQAREAQIEAALERVRAASMAMHQTEDIGSVVQVYFEQLKHLDIPFEQAWITILKLEEGYFDTWFSPIDSIYNKATHFKMPSAPFEDTAIKNWKEGVPLSYLSLKTKSEVDQFLFACDEMTNSKYFSYIQKKLKLERLEFLEARHKFGFISKTTKEPPTKEDEDILMRFASVFEQTYTRFLDIQKAEAQAREANIEGALERIRAKSMAMHQSNELHQVVLCVSQEITNLGMNIHGTHLYRWDENDLKGLNVWFAAGDGVTPNEVYWPYFKHPLFDGIEDAQRTGKFFFTLLLNKREKNRLYLHLIAKTPIEIPEERKNFVLEAKGTAYSVALGKHAGIAIFRFTNEPFSFEENEILQRFTNVFEQAFTRFLDLQKAEAQTREAQVEAALERVRSRTMAMHNSSELAETAAVLFQQLRQLGLTHERTNIGIVNEAQGKIDFWLTTQKGELVNKPFTAAVYESATLKTVYKAYKAGKKSTVIVQKGAELKEWIAYITKQLSIPFVAPAANEKRVQSVGFFSRGMLIATSTESLSTDELRILERFTAVFDQTYARFLDLQKAEAQTREAQIEVALERVRARASAMHNSEELMEVALELRTQMALLGQKELEVCGIHLYEVDKDYFESWGAMRPEGSSQVIQGQSRFPKKGVTIIEEMLEHYHTGKKDYVLVNEGKKAAEFFTMMKEHAPDVYRHFVSLLNTIPAQERIAYWSLADFKGGSILMVTYHPPEEDSRNLLRRVANVFDLAYKRYVDLRNAEASAREAQVEAALERIRSQAMAMKESADLLDIVVTMRTEFINLGFDAGYFWYMRWQKEKYEKAMTSGDGTRIGMVMELPRSIHGEIPLLANWEKSNRSTVVYPMDADTAIAYVDKMVSLGDFKQVDPNAPTPDDIRHIGGITFIMARTTYGEIGYSLNGVVKEPPAEALALLERFAGVFDLAYRRFEDLQVAEAQAKAATKQASLDRVRAEIASMRKTRDLEQITPLLWQELRTLGVPFFRCGVFIVAENEEMVHAYLSTPEGASLAALHLAFNDADIPLVRSTVKHWRLQEAFTEEWTKKEFINTTKRFLEKGQITNSEAFQAGEEPPEHLSLQLVPFRQGMLYVGSKVPLDQEQVALIKDLADAFAVAYARYEDFIQLEEAKKKVDIALSDLKAAQSQLIHSEKMASLGELTAGIAHEIQNPLNFVNNFSEVSGELLDEMQEEIEKGDLDEITAISTDLKENLSKINHHGKRASDIVKSMLEHSRQGEGKKEPSDINKLADEYLRLAYHGLRAKDKSFNAEFALDLDPSLPKVNVVPQDIGRVLLNLINNAFHAVREVENPLVTVTTTASPLTEGGLRGVQITVSDNGTGIPEHVRDKIFQPFFTTKPTGQGTGLGLSLSYDIVKAHGGELSVESKSGQGSTFRISLPKTSAT